MDKESNLHNRSNTVITAVLIEVEGEEMRCVLWL